MSLTKDHLHSYKRVASSKVQYYCTDPDCYHRNFKKYMADLRALCPKCLEPFIMRKKHLRLAIPHCDDCTRGSKAPQVDSALDELL